MENNADDSSRGSTPAPASARFSGQSTAAEDLLKSQTVGLVKLDDFRKRRAEALDTTSGRSTPITGSG